MGIIADDMAEVVERTKTTMEGAATQLRHASYIELVVSDPNVIQLNVDGIMLVHIDHVDNAVPPAFRTTEDTENAKNVPVEVRPLLVDNRKTE